MRSISIVRVAPPTQRRLRAEVHSQFLHRAPSSICCTAIKPLGAADAVAVLATLTMLRTRVVWRGEKKRQLQISTLVPQDSVQRCVRACVFVRACVATARG